MYKNTVGSNGKLNNKHFFWGSIAVIFLFFFYLFSDICFPFVVGFILAYLLDPIVTKLSCKFNRSFVSLLFAVFLISLFIISVIKIIPFIRTYLFMLAQNLPSCYDSAVEFVTTFSSINLEQYQDQIENLRNEMQKYLDQKIHILLSILSSILSKKNMIASFCSFFVIMPISFYYFMKDWGKLRKYLYKCTPISHRRIIFDISVIVRSTFRNFLHGQFYVVLILSFYYIFSLFCIGIPHNIVFGFISGMFSFIPFLGSIFSCILVMFLSVQSLTLTKFYFIIIIYMLGQLFEGYVLSPRFVGSKTGLHPLWILFSFFAGVALNGILGVLIAIPFAAVANNLIGFLLSKFKASQAYKQ